ncbi:hypothetical protein V5N11_018327 [Cardamine amara subsp. amara]|uniref:Transmembrane protein n=1 Tax=Cardamine amara subsp. amara TaxID=228776 RepID=A0ABD1A2S3_CARAN
MTLHHQTSQLNRFHLFNPQSPRLSSISRVSVSTSHRTQFQSLVICAKRKKKRVEYRRISRFLFNSLSLLSPNLQILQQPLDLVITELGGVDGGGGGLGFWRGWGGFDGWRKKSNRVPILVFVCVILWIYGFCKISGKEIKTDQVLKVLWLCLFGVTMVKELKREARFLVFGFLCFIASLVIGFKKENFVKLASVIRSYSSVLFCKRRRRRRV